MIDLIFIRSSSVKIGASDSTANQRWIDSVFTHICVISGRKRLTGQLRSNSAAAQRDSDTKPEQLGKPGAKQQASLQALPPEAFHFLELSAEKKSH
jgi:hypothetical protein